MTDANSVIYELQKLLTNVRWWVANGQSETAVKAIDEARTDCWAAMGWKEVCAREDALLAEARAVVDETRLLRKPKQSSEAA